MHGKKSKERLGALEVSTCGSSSLVPAGSKQNGSANDGFEEFPISHCTCRNTCMAMRHLLVSEECFSD